MSKPTADEIALWRKAWLAGFNEGVGLALMRLESANDETSRQCIADAIRRLEIPATDENIKGASGRPHDRSGR